LGIGCGWNAEEMEDYGTVYETRTLKMREQIEAMKEIWTKDTAEYHGQVVGFPPMQTWPKPAAAASSGDRGRRLPPRRTSCDPLWRRNPARSAKRRLR
jgi:alkanesulfonate monooxygenase SsuD/methylene tetrahydromethanopterin reductase-like flavin-dependent oxidoreductase (luciferase family)